MERMSEIIFVVEEDPDGGYTARALGESIFTEADSLSELKESIRDAIGAHFDSEDQIPPVIRLHHVHDELLPYAKTSA